MTTKKKKRTKSVPVRVEFLDINPAQWGMMFSLYWPPVLRPVMARLFEANGIGPADEILDGWWSRAMQINRIFIKHKLPFRLRDNPLPAGQMPAEHHYHIQTLQLKLCTVVPPSYRVGRGEGTTDLLFRRQSRLRGLLDEDAGKQPR